MASLRDSFTYQPVELSFGTSGLRGLVTDMTDLECYVNTAGFIRFLQGQDGLQAGENLYLAGDLRDSTPRIAAAVQQAVADAGLQAVYCGLIPTPALAYYALQQNAPCIMVTGSHIPADRNGIKFYKRTGEVLKADEQAIKAAVAEVRTELYEAESGASPFDANGALKQPPAALPVSDDAATAYHDRYVAAFGDGALAGVSLVFYQHSAVGRDLLVDILQALGAAVTPVGRSDVFVPIDTENVTPQDQAYFRQLAQEQPGVFAIVSTDGDSDRPFVVDEHGVFNRGDVLGAVVAKWLKADFAAYPVSSSDAVDSYLADEVPSVHTRIGSPYVIVAMQEAGRRGSRQTVGWEVNGGFLTGSDMELNGTTFKALPTRDAILPIIVALVAARQTGGSVSELFAQLPSRYTQAGLIDDFPSEVSQQMIRHFSSDEPTVKDELARYFTPADGFGEVKDINTIDGVRITFSNGDIAHLRPSGNAPQLRIYSVADSQVRADEIVALALAEPDGIFRRMQRDIEG